MSSTRPFSNPLRYVTPRDEDRLTRFIAATSFEQAALQHMPFLSEPVSSAPLMHITGECWIFPGTKIRAAPGTGTNDDGPLVWCSFSSSMFKCRFCGPRGAGDVPLPGRGEMAAD